MLPDDGQYGSYPERAAKKSSRHSPCIRHVIADDSPAHICERGLREARPEKKPKLNVSAAILVRSLQSALDANSAKNGQVSRISAKRKADFLCSPDCMAEREGFEPPIPVKVCPLSRRPVIRQ